MLTRNGSVPAFVMRTGMIQPMSPETARRDLVTEHIDMVTNMSRRTALYAAPPSPTHTEVAKTVTAVPPAPIQTPPMPMPNAPSAKHAWHERHRRVHPAIQDIKRLHPHAQLHGAENVELGEWAGRPVAMFNIQQAVDPQTAQAQVNALRRAAGAMQSLAANLPPELVGGPMAALMRGGAVELHFQNGVVIRTAL